MANKNNPQSFESQEDMYICLHEPNQKRKNLLTSLKHSLIVQEEIESIGKLRKEKLLTLKQIKKNTDLINSKYQDLKKLFPSVKNILNYTEKEIEELDTQISRLKKSIQNEETDIASLQNTKEILTNIPQEAKKVKKENVVPQKYQTKKKTTKKTKEANKTIKNNSESKTKPTKLSRIKNNLSLIEDKLKNL